MLIRNLTNWFLTPIKDIKNPESHLIYCNDLLKRMDVKYYLGFGTVLGLYRDGDFIPNDTDIDINITDYDDFVVACKEIIKKYKPIRIILVDEKIQQYAFQSDDGMTIDLCYYATEDGKYITRHEEGAFADDIEVVGDCPLFKTKYGEFPFPKDIEKYLEVRYGKDWKTPQNKKSLTL